MDKQQFVREKLRQKIKQRQLSNKHYSYRAFARDLKISISTFSEFLSKRRSLGESLLLKLAQKSGFTPIELEKLTSLPLRSKKRSYVFANVADAIVFLNDKQRLFDDIFFNGSAIIENDEKILIVKVDRITIKKINELSERFLAQLLNLVDEQKLKSRKNIFLIKFQVSETSY